MLLTRTPFLCRLTAAAAFGLGSIALVITLSRGGWVGSILAVSAFSLFACIRGRLPFAFTLGVATSGIVLCTLCGNLIWSRISGYDKGAAYSRLPVLRMASLVIADHPVIGVGVNNLAVAMKPYAGSAAFRSGFVYVVHNRYVQVCAETGVLGLLTFLGFLAATLRNGWHAWKRDDPLLSPIALGLTAGVLGAMAHMMVDMFGSRPQVQVLWVSAGLITAALLMTEGKDAC
jgi:putative inorganic carbon (HCO3(-)) transporter